MEEQKKNIFQRMSAVTMEISAVAKNLRVGEGRSSYKAVGEADVLAAVRPIEAKHGIYSYPFSRNILDQRTITTTKTYNGQTTEQQKLFIRVETVYRFVNVDEPAEVVDVTSYGDGLDAADKAPGKAMTYSDKYALLKGYKIITGEDPDQNNSDDEPIARAPRGRTAAPPPPPDAPTVPCCAECGQDILPTRLKSGQMATPSEVADIALHRFGRSLCAECMTKLAEASK
jgi:hypothetical protein